MIVVVPGLLDESELAAVRRLATGGSFTSGAATAGSALAGVKNNLESDDEAARDAIRDVLRIAFARSALVNDAVLPRLMTQPIVSLYREGMAYGTHLDNAMAQRNRLRSDISMTLFLSEPDDYEGGALAIQGDIGRRSFRLPAGDAVFYPTHYLHEVTRVTRGERLACVLWIQSLVREPERRRILADLASLAPGLGGPGGDGRHETLMRCHQNLLRMWEG